MNKNEIQEARAWLSEIRNIDGAIRRLCDVKYSLKKTLYSTGIGLSGMTSAHGNRDRMADAFAKLSALEDKITEQIDRLVDRKQAAAELIFRMPRIEEQDVLFARYMQFKPWARIAREMHFDESTVYRIHNRALYDFAKIFQDASL